MVTETVSTYLINLDQRTIRRSGSGGRLRRDDEALTLHQLLECQVGASANLLIEIRPGVATLRTTSHVIAIRSLRP